MLTDKTQGTGRTRRTDGHAPKLDQMAQRSHIYRGPVGRVRAALTLALREDVPPSAPEQRPSRRAARARQRRARRVVRSSARSGDSPSDPAPPAHHHDAGGAR